MFLFYLKARENIGLQVLRTLCAIDRTRLKYFETRRTGFFRLKMNTYFSQKMYFFLKSPEKINYLSAESCFRRISCVFNVL